jgi:hypothetical protein
MRLQSRRRRRGSSPKRSTQRIQIAAVENVILRGRIDGRASICVQMVSMVNSGSGRSEHHALRVNSGNLPQAINSSGTLPANIKDIAVLAVGRVHKVSAKSSRMLGSQSVEQEGAFDVAYWLCLGASIAGSEPGDLPPKTSGEVGAISLST